MKIFYSIIFAAVIFLSSSYGQFKVGQNTGGALIGIGGGGLTGTGSIPISLEYNFLSYEQNIQAGVFASYSGTSEDFDYGIYGNGKWSYTNIIIAAQGNYHFIMSDVKIDPFVGLMLGYDISSASWKWNGAGGNYNPSASASQVFWSAQAGLNYWFNPKFALQIRAGYYPYIAAGITVAM